MKLALGLIETIGLTAAVDAADAAVKSANVTLIGYELTKGDGMVTVKLEGDVGAVKAAVASAAASSGRIGKVVSTRVIPRPAEGLDALVYSHETVGVVSEEEPKKPMDLPDAASKPQKKAADSKAAAKVEAVIKPEVSPKEAVKPEMPPKPETKKVEEPVKPETPPKAPDKKAEPTKPGPKGAGPEKSAAKPKASEPQKPETGTPKKKK